MLDKLIDELLRDIFHDSGDENPFYLKFVDIDGVYKLNDFGELELIGGINMDKAILVIDMPSCCDECFALDEYGDYPVCRITQEQRGYKFRTREQRMDKCPFRPIPKKLKGNDSIYYQWGEYEDGWNNCIDFITGE